MNCGDNIYRVVDHLDVRSLVMFRRVSKQCNEIYSQLPVTKQINLLNPIAVKTLGLPSACLVCGMKDLVVDNIIYHNEIVWIALNSSIEEIGRIKKFHTFTKYEMKKIGKVILKEDNINRFRTIYWAHRDLFGDWDTFLDQFDHYVPPFKIIMYMEIQLDIHVKIINTNILISTYGISWLEWVYKYYHTEFMEDIDEMHAEIAHLCCPIITEWFYKRNLLPEHMLKIEPWLCRYSGKWESFIRILDWFWEKYQSGKIALPFTEDCINYIKNELDDQYIVTWFKDKALI